MKIDNNRVKHNGLCIIAENELEAYVLKEWAGRESRVTFNSVMDVAELGLEFGPEFSQPRPPMSLHDDRLDEIGDSVSDRVKERLLEAEPSELLKIVERLKSITSIRDEEKDLGYELEIRSLWDKLKARVEEAKNLGGGDCPTCGSKGTLFRSPLTDDKSYICICCTMKEGPRGHDQGDVHRVLGYGGDNERWKATPGIDIRVYRAIASLYDSIEETLEKVTIRKAYVFYDYGEEMPECYGDCDPECEDKDCPAHPVSDEEGEG